MYRIQWTYIKDENGNPISVKDFKYHDTIFEYEDQDDAQEDRLTLLNETSDKYFRIIEVE